PRHVRGEVLDGGDLLEDVGETGGLREVSTPGGGGLSGTLLPALVAEQPVERGGLQTPQIRDLDGVAELREGDAGRSGAKCDVSGAIGARGSQGGSFHRPMTESQAR